MGGTASRAEKWPPWLVKRGVIPVNPVTQLDRPPQRYGPPSRVPAAELMDALVEAAPRQQHLREKGGRTRDIPLPSAVMTFLHAYVESVLAKRVASVESTTPLFWSTWGTRTIGKTCAPMTDKNIWRLCKVYGRMIGCPELKPHDFRRTAVRNLERAGGTRSAAMKMVGHKTEAIYRRYAIADESMLREGAVKLKALFEAPARGGADRRPAEHWQSNWRSRVPVSDARENSVRWNSAK